MRAGSSANAPISARLLEGGFAYLLFCYDHRCRDILSPTQKSHKEEEDEEE